MATNFTRYIIRFAAGKTADKVWRRAMLTVAFLRLFDKLLIHEMTFVLDHFDRFGRSSIVRYNIPSAPKCLRIPSNFEIYIRESDFNILRLIFLWDFSSFLRGKRKFIHINHWISIAKSRERDKCAILMALRRYYVHKIMRPTFTIHASHVIFI